MNIDILYIVPVACFLAYIYKCLTRNYNYFHEKPIPSMATEPFFGSSRPLMMKKTSFCQFIMSIYNKFPQTKVFGMFDLMTPVFVLRDPNLIKQIAIKDFEHFVNHRSIFETNPDPNARTFFDKTLFVLNDHKWRDMRATLSPAFTGSKMRQMFGLIVECSANMVKYYANEVTYRGPQIHEMKDVFSKFTNDVIATCAFGIQIDTFKNPQNDFYVNGKKMLGFEKVSVMLKMLGFRLIPSFMYKIGMDLFDKEQTDFFSEIILETVRTREAQGIVRPDMVNLLMLARKGMLKHQPETDEQKGFATAEESDMGKKDINTSMTEMEMIAQCLIFFLAGFDTVSTCLTFLAYELALNRDVQQKLYEEILETSKTLDGKPLTYDAVQNMKYMDMVVSEILRMWPPAPSTDRSCIRDYKLDDGENLKFTIDKGTVIFIPIAGLHHDPRYFPNPSKFDPERFSEENRDKINMDVYLPFGIGPRNCIGSRFALMEVKAIVYSMLLNFTFEQTEKTQIPLKLARGFVMNGEKGVFVEFRPRK